MFCNRFVIPTTTRRSILPDLAPGTGIFREDISGRPPPRKITMKAWNAAILGTVIIWAGVIIATALVLAGTGYFGQLIPILGGGAAGNLIVLAGATGRRAGA
jgi:hypothetical protein